MIRLYASDLDGTLLKNHESDEIICQAVRNITERGRYFAVVTGRHMTPEMMAELGFDHPGMFSVSTNGSAIYDDKGTLLYTDPLPGSFVAATLREFPDVEFQFSGIDYVYSTLPKEVWMDNFRKHNYFDPDAAERRLESFAKNHQFDMTAEQIEEKTILKIACHLTDPAERSRLDDFLEEHSGEVMNAPFDKDHYEITHLGADKGTAVGYLAAYLGIAEDEVIVYGDSLNDMAMIRRFQHAYATADAIPEVKRAACRVLGYSEDHAVPVHMMRVLEEEGSENQ